MLDESKEFDDVGKQGLDKAESEPIKNKYDRRIYELDLFKSILNKVTGYDYRFPKSKESDTERLSTTGESDDL